MKAYLRIHSPDVGLSKIGAQVLNDTVVGQCVLYDARTHRTENAALRKRTHRELRGELQSKMQRSWPSVSSRGGGFVPILYYTSAVWISDVNFCADHDQRSSSSKPLEDFLCSSF